jgi:hypothetical protein
MRVRPVLAAVSAALITAALITAASPPSSHAIAGGSPGVACSRWRVVLPQGLPGVNLTDVATLSRTLTWAVGSYYGQGAPKILRWDGASWADEQAPLPEGVLNGVTAISATDAWAIGFDNVIEPLAMHWDGTSWSRVPTPMPGSYHYMYDIDGAATDDVWAVGNYSDSRGFIHPLALHRDGTTWSVADVPEAQGGNNIFYAVDAVATDDVWAVGIRGAGPFQFQPLIDHWDGVAWSVVPVGPLAGDSNQLRGVSGTSAGDAWAVGFYGDPVRPLIEHWDGTGWTQVDGSVPDDTETFDVAAISASDAWATGIRLSDQLGFTLHWDGRQWRVVAEPHFGQQSAVLSISASSSGDVWAVGQYWPPGSTNYPLTLHNKGCR